MNSSDAVSQVVVTGAGSYLGQQLLQRVIADTNWRVTGIVSPRFMPSNALPASGRLTYLVEDLSGPGSADLDAELQRADRVIHLAWIRDRQADKAIEGNMAIVRSLMTSLGSGQKLVFVSSVAASPSAHSSYGQAKFAVSRFVTGNGGLSLYCGLICASKPEGPFKQLCAALRRVPVKAIPIGRAPNVYPVMLDDVTATTIMVCNEGIEGGEYRLWGERIPLHRFMSRLRKSMGRYSLPVPAPFFLALPTINLLRSVRLIGPALSDQLTTFLYKDDEFLTQLGEVPGADLRSDCSPGSIELQ